MHESCHEVCIDLFKIHQVLGACKGLSTYPCMEPLFYGGIQVRTCLHTYCNAAACFTPHLVTITHPVGLICATPVRFTAAFSCWKATHEMPSSKFAPWLWAETCQMACVCLLLLPAICHRPILLSRVLALHDSETPRARAFSYQGTCYITGITD